MEDRALREIFAVLAGKDSLGDIELELADKALLEAWVVGLQEVEEKTTEATSVDEAA